jgi:hypothetical protein
MDENELAQRPFPGNSRTEAGKEIERQPGPRRLNVRFFTYYNICNYRCAYCIAGQGDPSDPRLQVNWDGRNYLPIIEALTRLPFLLNVRIGVDGEFFTSPLLIDGARRLSHSPNVEGVNLITNLSYSAERYRAWFADFDRSKIALVASFHPTEIRDRQLWLETALALARETDLSVCMVAHPERFEDLAEAVPAFRSQGLTVFVQAFIGVYRGRLYPEAYSAQERDFLRPLFYSRHDWEFLLVGKRPGLCNAGFSSVYVDMTGTVRICGMKINGPLPVGNLLSGEPLQLYKGPRPCTAQDCRCDTENMNTVQFSQFYEMTGLNQHGYRYRFGGLAAQLPSLDEWRIEY